MTVDAPVSVEPPAPNPVQAAATRARGVLARGWRAIVGFLAPVGNGLRIVGIVVWQRWRAISRVAAPYVGILTPVGWVVLIAGLAIGTVGLVLGWPELVFVAVTLVASLAVAAVFLIGRASYRVDIELQPHRVVVGERALGRMLVQNTAGSRSSATRMELPVGRGVAEYVIPGLAPKQTHEELFAVPTNRRAVIVAGPALSIRGDQLGLLRRTLKWAEPTELFVHPVTARLNPTSTGLVRDLEGEATRTITDADVSFHALRPYQPGDALRNIHWRTSARTGTLMVRQFEETRRSQLIVTMSADKRHYADEDEFELAISVMASISLQVIREGTGIEVVTEGLRLKTKTPQALLDDSCRIEARTQVPVRLREFVRDATKRLAPPSVVLQITGSKTDVRELREVRTLWGEDTRHVAIRVEHDGAATLGVLGGLTVATVGQLSQLVRLMGKVTG